MRRPGPRGRGSTEGQGRKRPPRARARAPSATWEASRCCAPSARPSRRERRRDLGSSAGGDSPASQRADGPRRGGAGGGAPGEGPRVTWPRPPHVTATPRARGRLPREAARLAPLALSPGFARLRRLETRIGRRSPAPGLRGESQWSLVAAEAHSLLSLREPGTREGQAPAVLAGCLGSGRVGQPSQGTWGETATGSASPPPRSALPTRYRLGRRASEEDRLVLLHRHAPHTSLPVGGWPSA